MFDVAMIVISYFKPILFFLLSCHISVISIISVISFFYPNPIQMMQ